MNRRELLKAAFLATPIAQAAYMASNYGMPDNLAERLYLKYQPYLEQQFYYGCAEVGQMYFPITETQGRLNGYE